MKNSWLVQSEWFSGARLLSMDLLDLAYGPAGLVLPRLSEVRSILRSCLKSYLESQPGGVADGWIHLRTSELYSGHIDLGLALLDQRTRNEHEKWLTYIHSRDPKLNPWVQYEDVVSGWAHSFFTTGLDDWSLGTDAQAVFTKVRNDISSNDIMRSCPTVDLLRLEAWDDLMLRIWHSDDARIEIAYEDFVVAVKLDIRMWRFQHFVQWAMRALSQHCLARLQEDVRKRAAFGGCAYVPVEQLDFFIESNT